MKQVLTFVMAGLVLWVASQMFPDAVQVDSIDTLMNVLTLTWLIDLVFALIYVIFIDPISCSDDLDCRIMEFILLLLGNVIALSVLSSLLDGFMVVGFWSNVLLPIIFSVLQIWCIYSDDN